jgi:hypothetical protein
MAPGEKPQDGFFSNKQQVHQGLSFSLLSGKHLNTALGS